MKKEEILIIRFSALGDVAMTVPVIDSLARQYPCARITLLTRSFMRPLFEYMPPNVKVMGIDLKEEYKGLKGLNLLYRRLKANRFSAIADLHSVLRSNYLCMRFYLDRHSVKRIDKHRAGRKLLVASTGKKLVQQPTSFKNYADVLERLGYPIRLEFNSIFPPQGGNLSQLPAPLNQIKKEGEKWIGIAPFAAHEGKVYPLILMEKVVGQLTAHHPNDKIFLFGSKNEGLEIFRDWCTKYRQCISIPQRLQGLREELILMSHLDVMVSMDSANMHMASIVGTRVVSVWGATHPYGGFMGWKQEMEDALQIDLPCRPCSIFGNKPCTRGDYFCLKSILPEEIVKRVEEVTRGG